MNPGVAVIDEAPSQEVAHDRRVWLGAPAVTVIERRRRNERRRLGRPGQRSARSARVERLDPEPVARKDEPTAGCVPERHGPHAIEALECVDAPCAVRLDHDLGVGRRREVGAQCPELGRQLEEVVDLPVVNQRDPMPRHRLRAGIRGVEDAQPPMRQRHLPGHDHAAAIRTAVRQPVERAFGSTPVDRPAIEGDHARDSAHQPVAAAARSSADRRSRHCAISPSVVTHRSDRLPSQVRMPS